jgi:amino acid permease
MSSERPNEKIEGLHESGDVEKDSKATPPYNIDVDGQHHEHTIVADRLARKLSARQVQMIAIGT